MITAGTMAVAYIQRHASTSGRFFSTRYPTAVPHKAPRAWKPKAESTSLPRTPLGMLSEIIIWAVG